MPKTILIVDDDVAFVWHLRHSLEEAGYRTLFATDGSGAMAVLDKYHQTIDLAVLDLALPDMSGYEILGLLRRHPNPMKILCITGLFRDEFLYTTMHMGADAALRKPYAHQPLPPEWLETVERLLGSMGPG